MTGIALLTVLCVAHVLLASSVRAAWLSYPLAGHFDAQEGTIELWFSPTQDFRAVAHEDFVGIAPLFSFVLPSGSVASASVFSKASTLYVTVSMQSASVKDALLPIETALKQTLLRSKVQHFAFAWQGTRMSSYLNGRLLYERQQSVSFEDELGDTLLKLGSEDPVPIVVHAVRTSNIARTSEDLSSSRPIADTSTLLLDRFDAPDHVGEDGMTRAQVISGLKGESGATVNGEYRLVDVAGCGISLARVSEERSCIAH